MPSFCAVSSCKRVKQTGDEISFHKFPYLNRSVFLKWVDFVNLKPDGTKSTTSKKITRFSSICSSHFLPSDFAQCFKRRTLMKTAVPSIIQKIPEENHDLLVKEDDDEPVEIQIPIEDPLSDDSCCLCKSSSQLLSVEIYHIALLHKCLPCLPFIEEIRKLCNNCLKILETFSCFIDNIWSVQNNVPHSNVHNSIQTPRIKIEPITNIEEEAKIPSIQVINFTQDLPQAYSFTKKCEILEIVDIKPFNFDGTLQNYDDEDEIQILSPTELKVELTDPEEDGSNELENIRNYVHISTVFLQDHNYFQKDTVEKVKTEYDVLEEIQPLDTARFCKLCGKNYKTFKKFLIHKLITHSSKSKLKSRRKISENQQKIRKVCSKIIKQRKLKSTKENEKPSFVAIRNRNKKSYKCPICLKNFPGPKNLYQHKISHQDSNYTCKLCSKKFKRAHGLKQHIKSIHEKEKNFECPICKHCFSLKADMKKCRHRALKKPS